MAATHSHCTPLAAATLRDAERKVRMIEEAQDDRDPQATARELARARQDVEALRTFGTTLVRRIPVLRQLGIDGPGRVVDIYTNDEST